MLTFPNPFCPLTPTDKQGEFLRLSCLEAFYGGAAGGGKSVALLMGALQYVDVPGYAALILRKDTQRLSLSGGLIPRSHEWLAAAAAAKQARWNEARRTWTFPRADGPPATLTFGYLAHPQDKYRYLSSEFQYIAFDELTELPEEDYLYLFSRLRKATSLDAPLRIRSASNPGGPGHLWVKRRFVDQCSAFKVQGSKFADGTLTVELGSSSAASSRAFIPSRLADNPFLDGEEYGRSLAHLAPLSRERLLHGDWSVQAEGLIKPQWLRYYTQRSTFKVQRSKLAETTLNVEPETLNLEQPDGRSLAQVQPERCRRFVTVDPAGTSADRARQVRGRPASHTVAQVWEQPRGSLAHLLILRHQVRGLLGFDQLVALVDQLHRDWRPERIWIENEKLGRAAIDQVGRRLPIDVVPTGGKDKSARASTLILKFSRGEIFLPKYETAWRPELEAELLSWTGSDEEPTDQIDAAAYAAIISQTAAPGILKVEHVV